MLGDQYPTWRRDGLALSSTFGRHLVGRPSQEKEGSSPDLLRVSAFALDLLALVGLPPTRGEAS